MARTGAHYTALNGAKLEYSSTKTGTYNQIYGLKTIPEVGGEPNTIDTTDLDNTEYETSIMGLKPAQSYNFEFNLELPTATANIKVVSDMEDADTDYWFKLTYASGITVLFESKVKTTLTGGSSGDLEAFTMHLRPNAEPEKTIPTTSGV